MNLSLLSEAYAICRLPPGEPVAPLPPVSFSLLVQAPDETTLVCSLDQAPSHAEVDAGWRCFRIEQSFDFSVPGILASVLAPLARAGIGIFATSTFSTDYVLVKVEDLDPTVEALRAAGHVVSL
ncbi:amino acid-binding protein [Microvirga aerophila]|uniref:Amino acid-binding protein n=1 Tax=Microvirga aerophila TaxID=670291 RepID=A0A512BSG1_9HYPH|nr:amino acid-binding protein [Microvirga aerophila]